MANINATGQNVSRASRFWSLSNTPLISGMVAAVVAGLVTTTIGAAPKNNPKERVVIAGPDETEPQHWPPARDAARRAFQVQNLQRWVEIETEPHERDEGDTSTRALLLCKDKTVVGVVGYLNTAAADTALKIYAKCGLAVIIIGATGSSLSASMKTNAGPTGILMAPTNAMQAAFAVRALEMTFPAGEPRIAIATDTGDVKAYVDDLYSSIQKIFPSRWPQDLRSGLPRTQSNFSMLTDPDNNFDAIIWLGMRDGAGELLRARRRGQVRPIIILSDGAVAPGGFPGVSHPQYCVWGLHPDRVPEGSAASQWEPSYAEFGADAGQLMGRLVARAAAADDALTRAGVLRQLRILLKSGTPVPLGDRTYVWDSGGQLLQRQVGRVALQVEPYHFYRLEPYEGTRWLHRKTPDPLTSCSERRSARE